MSAVTTAMPASSPSRRHRLAKTRLVVTPAMVRLVSAVRRRLDVQPEEMMGRDRRKEATYARHLAMYLLREDLRLSWGEIGLAFKRDVASVRAGVLRIGAESRYLPEVATDLAAVRKAVG